MHLVYFFLTAQKSVLFTSNKYFKENIKKFSAIDVKEKSFISSYYQSFWMVGNESIQFEHLGKKVGIALGCDNKQRDEVLKFLKYQQKKLHLKYLKLSQRTNNY